MDETSASDLRCEGEPTTQRSTTPVESSLANNCENNTENNTQTETTQPVDKPASALESAVEGVSDSQGEPQPVVGDPSQISSVVRPGMDDVDTKENLRKEAQQLIDDINDKRKQDSQLLLDFKKALLTNVEKITTDVEEAMFGMYDQQSKIMQQKLQQLFATFDRIAKTESELNQCKGALGMLYQDIA